MLDFLVEIRTIFSDVLFRKVDSPDTDLLETGVLDSVCLVDLLLTLEQRFGLSVDFEDLDLESFRSIRKIAAFVSISIEKDAPVSGRV
jgi:D-alanine--poly(phosphoribitol) ligase subunit 2